MKRFFMVALFCLLSSFASAGGMPGEEPIVKKEKVPEVVMIEDTNNQFKKFIFLLFLFMI